MSNTNASAPDNSTQYVGYVPDPNRRGTVTLVTSCLLTLLLCVWSALHLNVPYERASKWTKFWTNVKWVCIGVYAPELVVFTAWRQWSSAKILGKTVAGVQKSEAWTARPEKNTIGHHDKAARLSVTAEGLHRRYDWTTTHDFFASTGGFAFEIDAESLDEESSNTQSFLPPECPRRLTLTARGVALLAECGHLPDIPEADIKDKSKANNLAKALVVLQALWMLMQVIARLIAHLPVTLLEVNTVAHVLCAFLMYAMWWHKPLLAQEPITIRDSRLDALCAYMLMCSELSGRVDRQSIQEQTVVKKMFASVDVYSKTPEISQICLCKSTVDGTYDATLRLATKPSLDDMKQQQRGKKSKSSDAAFFERRPRLGCKAYTQSFGSASTIRRWELAAEAIAAYPVLQESDRFLSHDTHMSSDGEPPPRDCCLHPKPVEYVTARISNWPYNDLLRNVGGLQVGIVLWMCNFVYGGLHAAAWNEHFPSDVERWLWRISCVYIGFCGGLWVILNYLATLLPRANTFWESWMDGKKHWIWSIILGGVVFLCGSTFCASRVYLVIEAFMSIRSLVPAAYETPRLSQLMPHF